MHVHVRADNNSSGTVLKAVANVNACYFRKRTGHMRRDCDKYKWWLSNKENKNEKFKKTHKVNSAEESEEQKTDTVQRDEFLFAMGKLNNNV